MFCLLFHSSQLDSSHQFPEVAPCLKKPLIKVIFKNKQSFFLIFFLTALCKVPLPIASLCYLTDYSFFSAQKMQLSLSSQHLPGSCVPLQRSLGSTIPAPRMPAKCSHCINVNWRHMKNVCQTQLSVCLSPLLPESFFSPVCRLLLTPKAYPSFYSPVKF